MPGSCLSLAGAEGITLEYEAFLLALGQFSKLWSSGTTDTAYPMMIGIELMTDRNGLVWVEKDANNGIPHVIFKEIAHKWKA